MTRALGRRLLAELLGSAFLAAIVIGSGIAAQNLSPGDVGLQLFENSAATAAGLFAIILMFGPVSGAHFNPVVSLVDASFGGLRWRDAFAYVPAQIAGCILGAITANVMFALAAVSISTKHRATPAHLFAEVIATLGLLLVIFSLARTRRGNMAPAAVGAYIGAAYWFTSSTSFANPAISIGRMFSNTFAGIAPASVPGFVIAQLVGGAVAIARAPGALSRRHAGGGGGRRAAPHGRQRARSRAGGCPGGRGRVGRMRLVAIGGSDAGISAALRARELDSSARGDCRARRRLPELLDLRHPLLHLGRCRALAGPRAPNRRGPRGDRDDVEARHAGAAHRRRAPAGSSSLLARR